MALVASQCEQRQEFADVIASGGWHTCALRESGEVFCWGADDHGQQLCCSQSQGFGMLRVTARLGLLRLRPGHARTMPCLQQGLGIDSPRRNPEKQASLTVPHVKQIQAICSFLFIAFCLESFSHLSQTFWLRAASAAWPLERATAAQCELMVKSNVGVATSKSA